MFRIYSGIDQSAHLQRVQVWFEIINRFVSKLAEIAYFCKITSTPSCLVYWREKYYLCWSSRSVWINEGTSNVWIQWCRHEVSIYPSVVPLNFFPEKVIWQQKKVIWQQAASPQHMDNSMAFAMWRQCAPRLIRASLSPPKSTTQTVSRSDQPSLDGCGRRTDRQTDHAAGSVTVGRSTATRPNMP